MRLIIAAIGRVKTGPEQDLIARYTDRLIKTGKAIGITALETIELPESRASAADQRKREEAEALLARLGDAAMIVFDERGKSPDSRTFAAHIQTALDNGKPALAFVIGGPDGLDEAIRARASHVVAFGKLTMPHQIVRLLVAEQAYRATTILTNHPYHRD
ncbi:23S rRNA (pseudouridine(1915)-N(3))-methyltransferase RlmH [Pseudahrensia aquimaris]|uniref:Ribosomal RNA large subunit methyltransferase H n=1 Tax=Pseudahrensia aquimaris TaxID=744461 RepID=A0ABW3FFN3_9HYPH